MIHPGELQDRGPRPRPLDRVPVRALAPFTLGHEHYDRGDRILLRRRDVSRLVEAGCVEVILPLSGYRQCIAY